MRSIGFLTEGPTFSKFISELRNMNYIASKFSLNHENENDIWENDVVIIDLGYPLEKAYTFLSSIKNDYRYSETLVLVSIANKGQLSKLKSFALGADGYISPNIEFKLFYKRLKELWDPDKNLKIKKFPNKEIIIETDSVISHISESGCILNSNTKFFSDEIEYFVGTLFKELNLNQVKGKLLRSSPSNRKMFINEFEFQNLTDENRDRIREMINYWHTS